VQKVVASRPGKPSVLKLGTFDPPVVDADDLLIRVECAGVNFADCVARMGLYRSSWEMVGWPLTPGFEVAGTVVGMGPNVKAHNTGDRVLALTRFGGYAELVAVPEAQAFAVPSELSMVEAASIPVSFLTAAYALKLAAPDGGPVLVHSAAGGAGQAIAQLARSSGCMVVGTVGALSKRTAAFHAGCHEVLVREKGWPGRARAISQRGYIAVFDANGDTLRKSADLLAPMGRLIAYGSHGIVPRSGSLLDIATVAIRYVCMPRYGPLALANANRSVMGFNLSYLFSERHLLRRTMSDLLRSVCNAEIHVPPIETFPLSAASAAHERLHSGQTVGKVVLTTGESSSTPV
jgi:synaptic vesicle membrane protein VAT-1